jgi:F-type H+-transporting ATPase subunit c
MDSLGLSYLGAGLGTGTIVFGAAMAIARIASTTIESSARQPEKSGDLRTTMIIAAALVEGFTFFGLVVTILLAIKK